MRGGFPDHPVLGGEHRGIVRPNATGSSDPKLSLLSGLAKVAASQTGTTCGIVVGGGVSCIGSNGFGLLGTGALADSSTPVTPVGLTSGVTDISLSTHSCVIRSGGLWCWGLNSFGQAGPTTSSTPVQVPGIVDAVSVKTTGSNTCVLHQSATVSCLGSNFSGQLGTGALATSSNTPLQVVGITGVTSLGMGNGRACATTVGGTLRCWGSGSPLPSTVPGISNATKVVIGAAHICVLVSGGTVTCFGTDLSLIPVTGLSSVVDIESGDNSMCARTSTAAVYCWGSNSGGTLGDGTGFYFAPQKVVL